MKRIGIFIIGLFIVSAPGFLMPAEGATISWATLTNSTASNPGTVLGSISLGGQTVNVTYTGEIDFTQLNNTGYNYYTPSTTYAGGPSTGDMIAISGNSAAHTFTFSQAVTDPVMALVSLGQPGSVVSYNFDAPFTILSQGPGTVYGGCSTCLSGSGTSTLAGTEGDGIIQFSGTFTSLSWTATGSEYWNGFTIGAGGVPSSETPEPASWTLCAFACAAFTAVLRRKRLDG